MDIGGEGRGNERCGRREDGRLSKQPRKHTNRILRLRDRRSTVDEMICLLRKLRAILMHLFMPDRTGITASQAWLTEPATVAFTWLDKKLGGNEEYRTCCKMADAAIAVLENLGGRGSSLASREL